MAPLAVATALAVCALLVAEQRRWLLGVWIFKPLASLGFMACAWAAGAGASAYGRWMLVGLGLCALGDVCLIPRGNGRMFLIGIGAFALGHVVYTWAFVLRGTQLTLSMIAAAVMIAVVLFTLRWLHGHVPADMTIPIRVYMVVIAAMVAAAAGASAATADWRIALGAGAFAASDLSVARERFVRPSFLNLLWGLPLYYAAQLLLAYSIA